MITEVVTFDLPKGCSRSETLKKYRQTAPAWSKIQTSSESTSHSMRLNRWVAVFTYGNPCKPNK